MILRTLTALILVVVGAVVLMLLAAGFVEGYIWLSGVFHLQHALGEDSQSTKNYAFSSGTGPMVVAALGFSSLLGGLVRHINCEAAGCWRPGHRHPDHGRPVCRKHYHHDVAPSHP